MSIISASYFNGGSHNIPNIDAPEIEELMTSLIDEFEPKYLIGVLGYRLFKAFDAERQQEPIPERAEKLLTGDEFEWGGELLNWDGFSNETTFQSPIADYVMSYYVNDRSSISMGIGEGQPKSIHSDIVNPLPKIMHNWNNMIRKNAILFAYLRANATIYPEFDGCVDPVFFKPINYLGI